jgi:alkanesulfonate monooxygenase SsuD/methylene tetrahydromethanopterin reductase-like flavin-dependent oxidoreductase (luciferase family)
MRKLKFGVQFRNFPMKYGDRIINKMIDVAGLCESYGYDSIWMIDHLEMNPPISYEYQPIPECWSMISALASCTQKIKIGSLVSCALLRNPKYLTRICETVDDVSSGRLIVGIGSGWFEGEFRNYGIEFPETKKRISKTRETAQILLENTNRDGLHVPIWIGGSGETLTLKVVAKYADGCSLFGDPETIRRKLSVLREHCLDQHRDYDTIGKSKQSNVIVGESQDEVSSKLSSIVPDESKWKAFVSANIVGTPSKCREQVRTYAEAGIDYFTLSFPDLFDLRCLEIFSTSVIGELISIAS